MSGATNNQMTQVEFARHLGVGKSYVTALKKSGRLVMSDEGKVLVEESMASLARSSGAPERAAVVTEIFSDNRDKKDHYAAELARLDYEERCGTLLVAREAIDSQVNDDVMVRSFLESLPDRVSAELAAISDEQQVRARLADEVERICEGISVTFARLSNGGA